MPHFRTPLLMALGSSGGDQRHRLTTSPSTLFPCISWPVWDRSCMCPRGNQLQHTPPSPLILVQQGEADVVVLETAAGYGTSSSPTLLCLVHPPPHFPCVSQRERPTQFSPRRQWAETPAQPQSFHALPTLLPSPCVSQRERLMRLCRRRQWAMTPAHPQLLYALSTLPHPHSCAIGRG